MNPNKISFRGLAIWGVCAVFFMYEFLMRTVLGTFQHSIMDDLQLSPIKYAILSSTVFQLVYGIMQLPVGIITERLGLKKTLFAAVVVCGVANAGFAFTHQYSVAILLRVMMGLGSSFGFVCLLVAVYDWMPRKNIALFIGLSQLIGTMGPMLAAGPLNMMAESHYVGWRGFFLSLAIVAGVLAVLIFGVVENKRETTGKFLILSRESSTVRDLFRLLRQPQIWFIAIFSACIYFSIEYLSENEGTAFLMAKGFTSTFSSYMITVAWLGFAISCPLLGFISDRLEKRKPVMIVAAFSIFIGLTGIIYFQLGPLLTALCFLLMGFGASGHIIAFAIIAEYCKDSYLAIGLAFNNAMIMLCAAVNAPLVGYVLSHASQTGGRYSLADYQGAFLILIGLTVLALIISSTLIKETFCKSMRENTILHPI